MALLARARHGPDVDQVVPNLKRLDRAEGFEIPQRLGQIFFELPQPFGLAAAELVQVGDGQWVGCSVAIANLFEPSAWTGCDRLPWRQGAFSRRGAQPGG